MYKQPNNKQLKSIWEKNLTNQKPSDEAIAKIEESRKLNKAMSAWIIDNCSGREQSIALTKLEETQFFISASLARNGVPKSE